MSVRIPNPLPLASGPEAGRDHPVGLVDRTCELQAALGYPVRMKMIKVLGSHRDHPLSVSEVAEILRISQPTATKHLRILYDAGFADRERVSARVHYTLNLDTVAEYRRLMDLAFAHALTRCVNHFDCGTCPFAETCI
jgi:ArsR family transcriptional regulator